MPASIAGLRSEDDPAHVGENRERARLALGATEMRALRQVHGARVVVADEPWDTLPEADAMVAVAAGRRARHRFRGLRAGAASPIRAPASWAPHMPAGKAPSRAYWRRRSPPWRRSAPGAGASPPSSGPCIAQGSYEVTAELRDAVGEPRFFAPGRDAAHWQFDLPGYCAARLGRLRRGGRASGWIPCGTRRGSSATGGARWRAAARWGINSRPSWPEAPHVPFR
jgi:hypothetical protein